MSMMPLFTPVIEAHDEGVTTTDPTVPTLLLLREGGRLRARPARCWERLGARLLARSLDRRLVEGDPPEGRPLLATRAQALVAPAQRRSMAANWEHLLALTAGRSNPALRRIPLCRDRIAEAESSVREMLVALVAPSARSGPGGGRGQSPLERRFWVRFTTGSLPPTWWRRCDRSHQNSSTPSLSPVPSR